jgi:hypothetical protein
MSLSGSQAAASGDVAVPVEHGQEHPVLPPGSRCDRGLEVRQVERERIEPRVEPQSCGRVALPRMRRVRVWPIELCQQ